MCKRIILSFLVLCFPRSILPKGTFNLSVYTHLSTEACKKRYSVKAPLAQTPPPRLHPPESAQFMTVVLQGQRIQSGYL